VAETLIRDLVAEVRHAQRAERRMRRLLDDAFAQLPASPHVQIETIPGIGRSTVAVLVAQSVDVHRFATPEKFVGYFGVFPDESTSGVDKQGAPLPPGTLRMSAKGADLARRYLWNAARSALRCNPAVAALDRRLKAKGTRGDIALGHCMRKLLHLIFAVWKTNRPFDAASFASPLADAASGNEEAVGHTRDVPAEEGVTTATATLAPSTLPVKPAPAANAAPRPRIDFAFLRQQVTMEQILRHLGLSEGLRGRGRQLRGPCPFHAPPGDRRCTFSVHLGKNVFRCF
jgi:hypothetical protein